MTGIVTENDHSFIATAVSRQPIQCPETLWLLASSAPEITLSAEELLDEKYVEIGLQRAIGAVSRSLGSPQGNPPGNHRALVGDEGFEPPASSL